MVSRAAVRAKTRSLSVSRGIEQPHVGNWVSNGIICILWYPLSAKPDLFLLPYL